MLLFMVPRNCGGQTRYDGGDNYTSFFHMADIGLGAAALEFRGSGIGDGVLNAQFTGDLPHQVVVRAVMHAFGPWWDRPDRAGIATT